MKKQMVFSILIISLFCTLSYAATVIYPTYRNVNPPVAIDPVPVIFDGMGPLKTFFTHLDFLGFTKDAFHLVCKELKWKPADVKKLCFSAIEWSNLSTMQMTRYKTIQLTLSQIAAITDTYFYSACILQASGHFKL